MQSAPAGSSSGDRTLASSRTSTGGRRSPNAHTWTSFSRSGGGSMGANLCIDAIENHNAPGVMLSHAGKSGGLGRGHVAESRHPVAAGHSTRAKPPPHRILLSMSARFAAETVALPREPLAIVGIGCRMPAGIRDAATFWEVLSEGVDAIGEMPADRLELAPAALTPRVGGFCSGYRQGSTRSFSGYRRVKRSASIPSSGCCWKSPGRPWRTLALSRRG